MATFDDDLRLAHVLADAVERTALELFGSVDLEVSVTDDGTLTTQVTQRLEELLRHHLLMVLSSLPHLQAEHPEYFEES